MACISDKMTVYPKTHDPQPTTHDSQPKSIPAIFRPAKTTPVEKHLYFMFMVLERTALRAVASFFASVCPLLSSDIVWLTRHQRVRIVRLIRSIYDVLIQPPEFVPKSLTKPWHWDKHQPCPNFSGSGDTMHHTTPPQSQA